MRNEKKYIELPTQGEELTPEDWTAVLEIWQKATEQGLTLQSVRAMTAVAWLKMRGVTAPRGNQGAYWGLVTRLAKSLDWLWAEGDGGYSLRQTTAMQLLPRIGELQGPASFGASLTFGEFRTACDILRQWAERQSDDDLAALSGMLWRPARTAFDESAIGECVERGRAMKPWQRQGAMLWLSALLDSLAEDTYTIGGEEVSFAPLFRGEGDGKGDGRGSLERIRLTLAATHVFGSAQEVDRTPLLTVLMKLLMDHEEYERLKKKK